MTKSEIVKKVDDLVDSMFDDLSIDHQFSVIEMKNIILMLLAKEK